MTINELEVLFSQVQQEIELREKYQHKYLRKRIGSLLPAIEELFEENNKLLFPFLSINKKTLEAAIKDVYTIYKYNPFEALNNASAEIQEELTKREQEKLAPLTEEEIHAVFDKHKSKSELPPQMPDLGTMFILQILNEFSLAQFYQLPRKSISKLLLWSNVQWFLFNLLKGFIFLLVIVFFNQLTTFFEIYGFRGLQFDILFAISITALIEYGVEKLKSLTFFATAEKLLRAYQGLVVNIKNMSIALSTLKKIDHSKFK